MLLYASNAAAVTTALARGLRRVVLMEVPKVRLTAGRFVAVLAPVAVRASSAFRWYQHDEVSVGPELVPRYIAERLASEFRWAANVVDAHHERHPGAWADSATRCSPTAVETSLPSSIRAVSGSSCHFCSRTSAGPPVWRTAMPCPTSFVAFGSVTHASTHVSEAVAQTSPSCGDV